MSQVAVIIAHRYLYYAALCYSRRRAVVFHPDIFKKTVIVKNRQYIAGCMGFKYKYPSIPLPHKQRYPLSFPEDSRGRKSVDLNLVKDSLHFLPSGKPPKHYLIMKPANVPFCITHDEL